MPTAKRPVIALAGRPNVGKSTLFNLLAEGPKALVHDTPGVTRDVRRQSGRIAGLDCDILDTAGALSRSQGLDRKLLTLSHNAWQQANIVLLVIDGASGVTPEDEELAAGLHRLGTPVQVVVNKADLKQAYDAADEALSLGFGSAVLVSAAHQDGLGELAEAIAEKLPAADEGTEAEEEEITWRLAIIGRPNAGKSTLVNKLLQDERMLTGATAGLTRESIGHRWQVGDKVIELIDTPGVRKKSRVSEALEQQSVSSAMTAAEEADAVILLLDANTFIPHDPRSGPLEQQDARLAELVLNQGKPLLVVLNKWDLVKEKELCRDFTGAQLKNTLAQVRELPWITISASKGQNLHKILPLVEELLAEWSQELATSKLNKWLEGTLAINPPPLAKGKAVRLKFMRQTFTKPPEFTIFGNRITNLPASYKRYLLNRFGEAFNFNRVPVRLKFKQSDNPFADQ